MVDGYLCPAPGAPATVELVHYLSARRQDVDLTTYLAAARTRFAFWHLAGQPAHMRPPPAARAGRGLVACVGGGRAS